MAYLRK